MSAALIRSALETALAAMSPAMATAYENAPFTPVNGTPYQRAYTLFADPDDAEMTGRVFWERGIFQVNLFYPLNVGTAAASARIEALRDTFPRGASFENGGVTVTIRLTPSIGNAQSEPDRFMIPIRIPFSAQITRS
ncbi:MAG: hypothetical protein J7496_08560 [Novosphingobium sp.]|nr:hypothetical protein [Novosphingobium sp.]